MERNMFDPPDTYLDTYRCPFRQEPSTAKQAPKHTPKQTPRNIPLKHTPIQTCFLDHGLARNAHIGIVEGPFLDYIVFRDRLGSVVILDALTEGVLRIEQALCSL